MLYDTGDRACMGDEEGQAAHSWGVVVLWDSVRGGAYAKSGIVFVACVMLGWYGRAVESSYPCPCGFDHAETAGSLSRLDQDPCLPADVP